jgi:hypothetical protein
VKEYGEQMPGLTVQDVPRMMPRIVLLDDDGHAAETTRVQSWRCDLIVEYLTKKLVADTQTSSKGKFW